MKNAKRWLSALMMMACLTCFMMGAAQAQVPGQVPDLSGWVDTWFKLTLTGTAYHFSNYGVKPTPATPSPVTIGTTYMKITSWDPNTGTLGTLTADVFTKDHETGQWIPIPFTTLNISYFAGSDLKFVGSTQIAISSDVTMHFTFFFSGQKKAGNFVLGGATNVKTIGGYMLEIDDAPGSTERWAGSVKVAGPMVSKVPFVPVEP